MMWLSLKINDDMENETRCMTDGNKRATAGECREYRADRLGTSVTTLECPFFANSGK